VLGRLDAMKINADYSRKVDKVAKEKGERRISNETRDDKQKDARCIFYFAGVRSGVGSNRSTVVLE
jgi:hypothetical protein